MEQETEDSQVKAKSQVNSPGHINRTYADA